VSGSPFSLGTKILGGAALFLFGVLALGFFLPTDWTADATRVIDAEPDAVYALLDAPEGWRAWTAWPDSGLVRSGPEAGAGAAIAWDDPELGAGSFRIVEALPGRRVRYQVEVGGGAMRTEGVLTLTPEDDGVEVAWHEEGNLGRNPLMGYWAFFMDRAQTTELERSLGRLGEAVSDRERSR
jgi:uncharacterized protein YndB with AHSA1/START domain